MKNWRTTIGGAVSVLGTSLIGVGLLSQLTQISPASKTILTDGQIVAMWWVALVGFILSCVGKFLTALFAADAAQVQTIADQVDSNTASVNALTKPYLK
jgi:hypothetical protein